VAVVTGGSRGIGAATARLAAERGYAVAIAYRADVAAAERVRTDIESAGGRAICVPADVAEERDVERLFATVDGALGPVDALVNNAGVSLTMSRLEAMTGERMLRMFAVNVVGTLLCAREAVRRMSTARGGRGGVIVNVSSSAIRHGSPGEYVDYAASKGAIDTLTLGLAREVATEGIRVAAVRPGLIDTDIHASSGVPDRIERMRATIPVQREGQPEEVARAILWLLSDDASYSTGAIVDVSGGR
jgi:NAD(P)-dependent dehydrogenase (short-subunit alcohol dehydrogenase family)